MTASEKNNNEAIISELKDILEQECLNHRYDFKKDFNEIVRRYAEYIISELKKGYLPLSAVRITRVRGGKDDAIIVFNKKEDEYTYRIYKDSAVFDIDLTTYSFSLNYRSYDEIGMRVFNKLKEILDPLLETYKFKFLNVSTYKSLLTDIGKKVSNAFLTGVFTQQEILYLPYIRVQILKLCETIEHMNYIVFNKSHQFYIKGKEYVPEVKSAFDIIIN